MNMIEKRMQARGQGGFTLIELLVVVAILGILAGVAVFAVGNLTTSADQNACKIEASTIKTARQAAIATDDFANDKTPDFLDDSDPKYFNIVDTNETKTVPPVVTNDADAHPGGDCPDGPDLL